MSADDETVDRAGGTGTRHATSTATKLRVAGLAALVVTVIVLAVVVDVPGVAQLRRDFAGTGPAGALGFALLYAALSLLPLPASVLTIAAGAVFGLARGLPIVVAGASLGAVAAFFLGRLLGRDLVQRVTGTRLEALDSHVAERGFWAVLTLRLIPIVPFSALNYLSGLTALRVLPYLAATVIGILPASSAYVAVGAYGTDPGSLPFLAAVGALALLVIGGLLARRIRGRRSARTSGDGAPRRAPASPS